ncbi:hypothetical protein AAY473_033592 [Plecturocebus cupreus]
MESHSVTQAAVQWHDLSSRNLCPQVSRDSSASASQIAGIIGAPHQAQLIFGFTMSARLVSNFLASSDPPALASQSAGITGSFTLSPWPECSSAILAHDNLHLPGSNTGFRHVGQAGLKLLTSGDPTALAPQNAGITRHEPLRLV